jgi:hypothetical protein
MALRKSLVPWDSKKSRSTQTRFRQPALAHNPSADIVGGIELSGVWSGAIDFKVFYR